MLLASQSLDLVCSLRLFGARRVIVGRLALRGFAAQRTLFAAMVGALVVCVSAVVGVLIATDSLRAGYAAAATTVVGGSDLRVQGDVDFGSPLNAPLVDPRVVGVVSRVTGVAEAAGTVVAFDVAVIGSGGLPVVHDAPQVGLGWDSNSLISGVGLVSGRPPLRLGEFAVDADTATRAGLRLNTVYEVLMPAGARTMALTGTVSVSDPWMGGAEGSQFVVFDLSSAMLLLNGGGGWNEVVVRVDDGAAVEEVAAAVTEVLPVGLVVVSSEGVLAEYAAGAEEFVRSFRGVLAGFAAVTALVAAVLIHSMCSIRASQRRRELGLLRALGASGGQIVLLALLEAVIVGIIGACLGLLGGVGVAAGVGRMFVASGGELPVDPLLLSSRTVGIAFAVGVGMSLVAGLAPALASRRVSPLCLKRGIVPAAAHGGAALISAVGLVVAGVLATMSFHADTMRAVWFAIFALGLAYWVGTRLRGSLRGVPLLSAGAAFAAVLLFEGDRGLVWLGGVAAVAVFAVALGLRMSAGMLSRLAAVVVAVLSSVFTGITVRLAGRNATRNSDSTAAAGVAIMVGVAFVVAASVAAASMKTTFAGAIQGPAHSEWFVCVDRCNNRTRGLPNSVGSDLAALSETGPVLAYRFRDEAFQTPDGAVHALTSVGGAGAAAHIAMPGTALEAAHLAAGEVLVHNEIADTYGLSVGDAVTISLLDRSQAMWVVGGTYSVDVLLGAWVVSEETWNRHFYPGRVQLLSMVAADGVTRSDADDAIRRVVDHGDTPARVLSAGEFADLRAAQIDQALIIVNVLFGLTLLIGVLGLAATLAVGVLERSREFSMLRVLGMTRRQVRRMVCVEGLVLGVFGCLLGVAAGLTTGVAAVALIPDVVASAVTVPWRTVGIVVPMAACLGYLVGMAPAAWASRRSLLDSIEHH